MGVFVPSGCVELCCGQSDMESVLLPLALYLALSSLFPILGPACLPQAHAGEERKARYGDRRRCLEDSECEHT